MNNEKQVGSWSGLTAPSGTALRRAQLIVDHHVSGGRLIYGPDALARAIADALIDTAFDATYNTFGEEPHHYTAEDRPELQAQRAFIISFQNKSGGAS